MPVPTGGEDVPEPQRGDACLVAFDDDGSPDGWWSCGRRGPALAYPFRYGDDGRPAVNEQDSIADVASCVVAALLTSPGDRDEHPDFGVDDLTFALLPVDIDAIVAEVEAGGAARDRRRRGGPRRAGRRRLRESS